MSWRVGDTGGAGAVRPPAVAGAFYPDSPHELEAMVRDLFDAAERLAGAGSNERTAPAGILVPHAGLLYSGVTAAAGWGRLASVPAPTVVLLGTNHGAAWLNGIGAWEAGSWEIPTGEVPVDMELAQAIVAMEAPFGVDREAHALEHSIEVQLPLLLAVAPGARIVPLAVSAGRRAQALDAGRRLGTLLAERRAAGASVVLAISSDMAHYPADDECRRVTESLIPPILALDGQGLAEREAQVCSGRIANLVCGMCGIEPAVLGLAALRAMGAASASVLASATSADAGGPAARTVGYLAVRFDGGGR